MALGSPVFLVGVGPGDPGLVTRKAEEIIRQADVLVYDRLIHPEILTWAPPHAERIYMGKAAGEPGPTQEAIHDVLIDRARRGLRVVRLKGGDPLLFGRGSEEAMALVKAGLSFEWVPGVSSALAAPAYAGIPTTHRGLSRRLTVTTGHDLTRALVHDVENFGTLVVLMGTRDLPGLVAHLKSLGVPGDMPAAMISYGTWRIQQTVYGELTTLVDEAQRARLKSPAVIVLGRTVTLHRKLHWWGQGPLAGRQIVILEDIEHPTEEFLELRALGAEVFRVPTARAVGALTPEIIDRLGDGVWLLLDGRIAADTFLAEIRRHRVDVRQVAERWLASDDETQKALFDHGLFEVDLLSEDLGTFLATAPMPALLWVGGDEPSSASGADFVSAWHREPLSLDPLTAQWLWQTTHDLVVWASPKTVEDGVRAGWLPQWKAAGAMSPMVGIGTKTCQKLGEYGWTVREITGDNLVGTIVSLLQGQEDRPARKGVQ